MSAQFSTVIIFQASRRDVLGSNTTSVREEIDVGLWIVQKGARSSEGSPRDPWGHDRCQRARDVRDGSGCYVVSADPCRYFGS